MAASAVSSELAWAFNLWPSAYCDASWLPDGLGDPLLPHRADTASPCHRYLSPWLLSQNGLGDRFHFDFTEPRDRMVLLDRPAVARLSLLLGLVLRRDALARLVSGNVLAELRTRLDVSETRCIVASADCFGLRLNRPLKLGPMDDGLAGRLVRDGNRVLMRLVAGSPEALAGRFRFLLPKELALQPATTVLPADQLPAMREWILRTLMPRMMPQWAWLFS